mgnify:CR=1 FL=1
MEVYRFYSQLVTITLLVLIFTSASAQKPEVYFNVGHNSYVSTASFSPNGELLLTGSADNTAKLWDVATGKLIRILEGHTLYIWSVGFSPDGTKIITGSWDQTVKLWETNTGKLIYTFPKQKSRVRTAKFSPDGSKIAFNLMSGEVKLFSSNDFELIKVYPTSAYSFDFAPNSFSIAIGTYNKGAQIIDLNTGNVIKKFAGHTKQISVVAFSQKGNKLLTGSYDKTVKYWDIKSGKLIHTFLEHTGHINSLTFSPNGAQIITGSSDDTAILWDLKTRTPIQKYKHSENVYAVSISAKGNLAVVAGGDTSPCGGNNPRLWNIQTGKITQVFKGHTNEVTTLCFSDDSKQIIVGNEYKIDHWNPNKAGHKVIFVNKYSINKLAFLHDQNKILSAVNDDTIRLWDAKIGMFIIKKELTSAVTTFALSPDKSRLVLALENGTLLMLKTSTLEKRQWQLINQFEGHNKEITSISFYKDGTEFITSSKDNTFKRWNSYSGKLIKLYKYSDVIDVKYFPDGKRLLINTATNYYWIESYLYVRDIVKNDYISTFGDKQDLINHTIFSPDFKKILSCSNDNLARIWDVEQERSIILKGHTEDVVCGAFSPNSKFIVTGSKDGIVKLWKASNGKLLATLHASFKNINAWVVVTPEGKYDGNKAGLSKLHYISGVKVFPLQKNDSNYIKGLLTKILKEN